MHSNASKVLKTRVENPGFEIRVNLDFFVFVGGVFWMGNVRMLTQTPHSLMSAATLDSEIMKHARESIHGNISKYT